MSSFPQGLRTGSRHGSNAGKMAVAGLLLVSWAVQVNASLIDLNLPGNTSTDEWTNVGMSNTNNPGYPTLSTHANPWPGPIGSDIGGDALFMKTAGGGYPTSIGAGGGIYTFDTPGSFEVYDTTPVASLATVVLQYTVQGMPTNIVSPPVLNYNGGGQALSPVTSAAIGPSDYLYQWDVSSLGPITGFDIDFGFDVHHQIFGIMLDQSDVFTPVPEPASGALLALAGLALAIRKTKRRS